MPNPFEILGLTPAFALDAARLEHRHRDLNRALHPDRHAGRSPAERRAALSRAMDINQAYRTLRDPASRAEALFEVLGIHDVAERSLTDPALLGEMLEQRELLDEARRSRDREQLAALKAQMLERKVQVERELGDAFAPLIERLASGAGGAAEGPAASAAQRLFGELKYIRRFGEEVAAIEDEM